MRLILVALFAFLAVTAPSHADDRGTLTLTGSGSVAIAPDIATVSVGNEARAEAAADALNVNSERTAQLIATLIEAGVAESDIRTSGFSVSPLYTRNSSLSTGGDGIDGYQVSNQVSATIRDLTQVGPVLDRLVRDGANRIGGISFGVSDDSAARDEARALAVADARHRAEVYARAAGVSLGPIIEMREGGPVSAPMPMALEARSAVPIQAGSTQISAAITVTWAILRD